MPFLLILAAALAALLAPSPASAQTLGTSQYRIEWQVVNRFRFFSDAQFFKLHENAWRQYLLHVDNQGMASDERDSFIARTSVLGSEHVLNDRYIAFSTILRKNFDWRGWAARGQTRCAMIPRSGATRPAAGSMPTFRPSAMRSNCGCRGSAAHPYPRVRNANGASPASSLPCRSARSASAVATSPCPIPVAPRFR